MKWEDRASFTSLTAFFSERLENFFAVLRVPIFEAKELNYSVVSKVNEHR